MGAIYSRCSWFNHLPLIWPLGLIISHIVSRMKFTGHHGRPAITQGGRPEVEKNKLIKWQENVVLGIVLDADGQDERESDVGCVGGSVGASSDRPADRSALASAASSEDDGRGCGCRGLGREPADSPPYRVSRALCFTCYLNKNCTGRTRFLRFVLSKKWRRKDGNGVSVSSRNSASPGSGSADLWGDGLQSYSHISLPCLNSKRRLVFL